MERIVAQETEKVLSTFLIHISFQESEEGLRQRGKVRYGSDSNHIFRTKFTDDPNPKLMSPLARNGISSLGSTSQKNYKDAIANSVERQTETLERIVDKLSVFLYNPPNTNRSRTRNLSLVDYSNIESSLPKPISISTPMTTRSVPGNDPTQLIGFLNKSAEENRAILNMMLDIKRDNEFLRNSLMTKISAINPTVHHTFIDQSTSAELNPNTSNALLRSANLSLYPHMPGDSSATNFNESKVHDGLLHVQMNSPSNDILHQNVRSSNSPLMSAFQATNLSNPSAL